MIKQLQLLILILVFTNLLYAAHDSLYVSNGDVVIVGEIKNMERGVLTIETEYSDSDFKIDWAKILKIYSSRMFIITNTNGDRYYGTIRTDELDKSQVIIIEDGNKFTTKLEDIVFVNQVDEGFLSRLSASFDIGFSHSKTNNLTQFSMRSHIGYLADNWSADAYYNGVNSNQDNVDATRRNEGGLGFRYFLPSDWFLLASYNFLQNDEQKLKVRSTSQIGAGNYIVRTNAVYFGAKGGIAWNNENYTEPEIPSRNSAEGFLGLELNLYDIGDISLLSNLLVYPSFTESGRVRSDFKIDLKYDLPLDIYFKLGYTLNYDNRPVAGASESDYVFQTTVGWEF